jgi:beta-lactamase regulating signal transducer with metallopeptidase domain
MEANLLRHFISTSPAELLIASIWQGLLLTAFAWAALKLAPGLRASTRFTVWLIVFTLVALLPGFALGRALVGQQSFAASSMPQAHFSFHVNVVWAFVIEGLWVCASLFSLVRLLASGLQMRTLFQRSTPVPFDALDHEIQSVVARPGLRPVEVRLSDAVDAPSVLGFFHPAVIVPRSLWSELTPAELKQIVLHEMAHLDRGDDWTNLLQKLLRAFSPLNPALFWAERHLCREREQACDDAVLDAAVSPRAYATCLTNLAESRLVKRAASLAPGLWRRHSELAGRIENILHRRPNLRPVITRSLVGVSLCASLAGAIVLQQCPGIITFANIDAVAAEAAVPSTGNATYALERNYQNQPQARYQQASFHPASLRQTMNAPSSAAPASLPSKPHAAHKVYPAHVRFLELRSTEDGNAVGMTLIVFTVEVPQTSSESRSTRTQLPATALSTTDSWIVFQI